ncbi:MAG TPA: 50S ribosomal protein L6, partial [Terriglobia bacterium]|nr:50S ribosomal protein L6 [Terriglobia bacterium]
MSRIGKKVIPVPDKVKIEIQPTTVKVTGPKGVVTSMVPPGIRFEQKGKELVALRQDDSGQQRAFHGLARALAANAVRGVTEGFTRELDIVGVGYRAESRKNSVVFTLGFAHPIEYPLPPGISVTVDKQTHLVVSGVDRQLVGQVAANMRALKKPDPYKQKGIRYTN